MFKVLLWDLDNTILDFNLAQDNSLKAAFERYGLGECSDETVSRFNEINNKHWQMLERNEITKDEVYRLRFEEFLGFCGKMGAVDPLEINDCFENGICNTISFLDDSFNLLCSLKDDYALYCVTNGATEIQKKRLNDSTLINIFRKVFISDEIGYDKPKKEFFDYALANIIPCEKEEILIIGDSLTSDMKGGNNAGIKCCWYNPSGAPKPNDLRIDFEIKKLDDIKKILGF